MVGLGDIASSGPRVDAAGMVLRLMIRRSKAALAADGPNVAFVVGAEGCPRLSEAELRDALALASVMLAQVAEVRD